MGKTAKDCKFYNKQGKCMSKESPNPGHSWCIGKEDCSEYLKRRMMEHSKLPFEISRTGVVDGENSYQLINIFTSEREFVASLGKSTDQSEAYGAFIVTACNKHERLVECLNDMYRLVESHKECWTEETESDGVTPTMFAENRIREIEKAKQLLSEIEGDTIPGNIRSDAKKRKTDLGKYR